MVLAYLSVGSDEPTVREQRDLTQAVPVVQRALGDLIVAAGPEVAVELRPFEVEKGCRISAIRDGAILRQAVVFRVGDAPALLDRIAKELPAGYRAAVRRASGGGHALRADAGEFVSVRGAVAEPGVVTLTASTGCRPADGFTPQDPVVVGDVDAELARVLEALDVTDAVPGPAASVACRDGVAATVRATGQRAPAQPLHAALRPLGGTKAVVVVDHADRYAYRSGSLSVVAEAVDDEIRLAVTRSC